VTIGFAVFSNLGDVGCTDLGSALDVSTNSGTPDLFPFDCNAIPTAFEMTWYFFVGVVHFFVLFFTVLPLMVSAVPVEYHSSDAALLLIFFLLLCYTNSILLWDPDPCPGPLRPIVEGLELRSSVARQASPLIFSLPPWQRIQPLKRRLRSCLTLRFRAAVVPRALYGCELASWLHHMWFVSSFEPEQCC